DYYCLSFDSSLNGRNYIF
nr:immunoglobulin light chain junction region [Macaca mulatta]MOX33617.1 immunoglobulin light chain junction region [Macaca mulatta]MOX33674.1 immunoglobulin light chain junction region [Macaca mulatta]MOX33863.1 immunoglobulin light chain junction region [Macaca mulatta]MOX33879.1 immunoglobulin light chain junction region [Macaca mulatta]